MENKDSVEGGGLPRRDSKSAAGIGLPGGRRQVKMPETVRSDAMPPRSSGGGFPSRREVRHPSQQGGGGLPGASTQSGQGGLPARGEKPAPVESAGEGLPTRRETNRVPVTSPSLPPSQGSGETPVASSQGEGMVRRRRFEDPSEVALPVREGGARRVEPAPVETSAEEQVALPLPRVDSSARRVESVSPVDNGYSVDSSVGEDIEDRGVGHGGYREVKRQVSEKSPLAGSESWEDEDVPDTHLGLNAEAPTPKKKKKAKLALTKRDIEIITLCARYRFAYREQIQHYFQSENVRNRLTRLADEGLLRKDMVTQNQALWLPSQAGLDVADLDLTHIERGRYSATSIAHSIGLLNLGIEFEKGWENLLKEDVWPNFNRVDKHGNRLQGETVITEREITNSFNRLKGIAKGDARKTADVSSELLKLRNDALGEVPAPGKLSLEMREGMAGLFVGYFQNKSHTPDMVIARPRSQDGTSNHIAIELELNPKPIPDWIRILRSFKSDPMFASVVYFTHKRSIMTQLTEINKKHVGLTPEQFKILKYTPRNDSIPFWG